MSGNKASGLKAAVTNKSRNGSDYYANIGSIGGKATGHKGFAISGMASEAGKRGGLQRRGKPLSEAHKQHLRDSWERKRQAKKGKVV